MCDGGPADKPATAGGAFQGNGIDVDNYGLGVSETGPIVPSYKGAGTLILHYSEGRQLARLDTALWPPVGTVVELGDDSANWDARVMDVRLSLPMFDGGRGASMGALVLVFVEPEPDGQRIPRSLGARILYEEAGESGGD